jgi:hypothetical protein
MIEIVVPWVMGFLVGYLVKKSTYVININLKQNGTSNEL